jgi:hypothetical protein
LGRFKTVKPMMNVTVCKIIVCLLFSMLAPFDALQVNALLDHFPQWTAKAIHIYLDIPNKS